MEPLNMLCNNPDCPSCGQEGKGNVIWHHKATGRLKCKVCNKTFHKDKGTPFFGLRKSRTLLTIILILIAHGCPTGAIVAAFNLDRRTVSRLLLTVGEHCEKVHQNLVEQPRDHGQIQADEIYGNIQAGKSWVAMAIAVPSRLWLGAVSGPKRTKALINSLAQQVRRCSLPDKSLLIVTDGLKTYINSFKRAFSREIKRLTRGRRRKKASKFLVIAQGVKSYTKQGRRYICHGFHHCTVAIGKFAQVASLIKATQTTSLLHTAYIERINATFRQNVAPLVRRSRNLLKLKANLDACLYLEGTYYNFCRPHGALGKNIAPAMKAGITQHIWSVKELLEYKVPAPLWKPSKRGRRTKEEAEIISKWRPDLV